MAKKKKKFAAKGENSINKGSAYGELKSGKQLLHTTGDYNRDPLKVRQARQDAKKRAEAFGGLFD